MRLAGNLISGSCQYFNEELAHAVAFCSSIHSTEEKQIIKEEVKGKQYDNDQNDQNG